MISINQLLISLAGFLIVPILFNYGGGAANPALFFGILLYLFCDFLLAIFLFTRSLAARVLALLWHGAFLGCAFWLSAQAPNNTSKSSHGSESVLLLVALDFIYLAATSFPKIYARVYVAVKTNPAEVANQGSPRSGRA